MDALRFIRWNDALKHYKKLLDDLVKEQKTVNTNYQRYLEKNPFTKLKKDIQKDIQKTIKEMDNIILKSKNSPDLIIKDLQNLVNHRRRREKDFEDILKQWRDYCDKNPYKDKKKEFDDKRQEYTYKILKLIEIGHENYNGQTL